MKAFILILLISYILSLYSSSSSTTSKQLFNLPLYGSVKYNGNYPSLSILDISGFEDDIIYISYYIKRSSFKTSTLKYGFTDVYLDEYFKCVEQAQKTHSSTTSSGKKHKKFKTTSIDLYYEIKKQNKKYLVLENLLYEGYDIEVNHHRYNPKTWIFIFLVIFFILWISGTSFGVYTYCKNKKRTKSENIDFNKEKEKKEEPSPLYPSNQTDDSTQDNTITDFFASYPRPFQDAS